MNKKLLEQLEQRTRARLTELKDQIEKGEVRAEELATIQAEAAKLGEELQGIQEALSKLDDSDSDNDSNAADSSKEQTDEGTDDSKDNEEKDKEKEKDAAALAEQRSVVMAAIGAALSTRNAAPQKRKENEVRAAFASFVVGKITEQEARSLGIEVGNGSVTVPEVIASEVIAYAQEQNLLRKYGTVHRTKGDVKFPVLVKKMDANVTKKERGMTDEIPETGIEFDEILLSPAEFDALATVTKKLLKMSGAPIEKIVIDELKKAYVRKETNYMFNGDDVGNENEGALAKKAVSYYEKVAVNIEEKEWSQRLYPELVRMKNQPVTEVLKKSMWIVNRAALTLLESMVDATGRPLLHVDATDGVSYKLLGHKLDFTDAADSKNSAAPVFYFGDFSAFHIQDVVGSLEIQKLVEQYARTNRVGFQIYNLLDGQLVYSAFEPAVYRYEIGTTAPAGGGTDPQQGGNTPTPTPTVEFRALTTADITKRTDNTSDTFTVDASGNVTNSRVFAYPNPGHKTAVLLPTNVNEMIFKATNDQHWIIVGADENMENSAIIGVGANRNAANAVLGENGTISSLVQNVGTIGTQHTFTKTKYYKVVNSETDVKVYAKGNDDNYILWFTVTKASVAGVNWYTPRLGAVGGIGVVDKTTQTILGEAKIKA